MAEISEVRGQYLIISDDGEQFGPYDQKKKAAAKYRDLQREEGGEMQEQSQSKAQRAATRFAAGVNSAARKAGQAGRKIADKAEQAADEPEQTEERTERSGGPSLPSGGMGGGMESGGPGLEMFGGGGGNAQLPFAQSDEDESNGPSLGFLEGGSDAQVPAFGPPRDADNPMMMGDGPDMDSLPFGRDTDSDTDEFDPMRYF